MTTVEKAPPPADPTADKSLECALCQSVFKNPCTLCACRHLYCLECVAELTARNDKIVCPECRRINTEVHMPQHNRALWGLVSTVASEEEWAQFSNLYNALASARRFKPINGISKFPVARIAAVYRQKESPIAGQVQQLTAHRDRLKADAARLRKQATELETQATNSKERIARLTQQFH